jgi:hypothetical protein
MGLWLLGADAVKDIQSPALESWWSTRAGPDGGARRSHPATDEQRAPPVVFLGLVHIHELHQSLGGRPLPFLLKNHSFAPEESGNRFGRHLSELDGHFS